jgi:hypothetical protein
VVIDDANASFNFCFGMLKGMHELDLIPASYKERQKIKGWIRLFGVALVALLVVVACLWSVTVNKTKTLNEKVEVLQKNKQLSLDQQQNFKTLIAEENKLKKDLEVLNGLRGGPTAKQILLAVDRVMQKDVWFTQWSFTRAREITQIQPATVQTSYFIIIPQDGNSSPNQQAWKLDTHMEITGQALDHSSFSHFIKNLINQPEVDDVKVINTSLRNYTNSQVVDFKIIVIIDNKIK